MSLDLSTTQTNDAKILYLTDVTTTWGTDPSYDWTAVTAASLTITYNTTNNKDFGNPIGDPGIVVDITSIFDAAIISGLQTDLVFTIDSDSLNLGSDAVLPDGIYRVTYEVTNGATSFNLTIDIKLDQNIKNGLYTKFASLPLMEFCNCKNMTKNVDDLVLSLGLLWSTDIAATVARKANILDTFESLERLVDSYPNGTNIR